MKEFKNHSEALQYAKKFAPHLYEMEELYIPFDKYRRYMKKYVGKSDLHIFKANELGNTGIFSIPYVKGKMKNGGISTAKYMPYTIAGNPERIFVMNLNNLYPYIEFHIFSIYSDKFFYEYKAKRNLPEGKSLFDVVGDYFPRCDLQLRHVIPGKHLFFSKVGVAISYVNKEKLLVFDTFDDSLTLDPEVTPLEKAELIMDKYASKFNNVP